jgi:glycosyltransferase involved in cell wall biosynthesis
MKIAFDHQAFTLQKTGGVSRYFCRLADRLSQSDNRSTNNVNVGVFAPVYRNQYLRQVPKSIVHGYAVSDYPLKTATVCVNANRLLARQLIKKWQPDIVHETYFSSKQIAPAGCPVVLTVFDMISELDLIAKGCSKKDLRTTDKYKSVMRADHVICISQSTKQDFIDLFDISAEKISVVYLACDPVKGEDAPTTEESNQRPYLLYVGLRDGYKNFNGLLRAISSSPQIMKEFDLLAFGGGTFNAAEQDLIKDLGFGVGQVKQIGGGDAILNSLYKKASALVYPSTYEGFGLPPLEAMSHRCPVISSNTSSMPEIIAQAGQYFDPHSTESMTSAIEAVVLSSSRTKELIKLGVERQKYFTWERCAQETLSIYRALAPTVQ